MEQSIFDELSVVNFQENLFRNIKSIRIAQDLYDDLSDNPVDWGSAHKAELNSKPKHYSPTPIINRPFDEALFIQAIDFPFKPVNWAASRFSNGNYGVWYGALEFLTTIHETVHHWRKFLKSTQFDNHDLPIISERRVFKVYCDALLLDLRKKVPLFPKLVHPEEYSFTQTIGQHIHSQGHPGLLNRSARFDGDITAIFHPKVLSSPIDYCYLSYSLDPKTKRISIERTSGEILLML